MGRGVIARGVVAVVGVSAADLQAGGGVMNGVDNSERLQVLLAHVREMGRGVMTRGVVAVVEGFAAVL